MRHVGTERPLNLPQSLRRPHSSMLIVMGREVIPGVADL
jgi:hypothetical protein